MSIRILIADDHSVVRQGLRMSLGCFASADPELEVVGKRQMVQRQSVSLEKVVRRAQARRVEIGLQTSPQATALAQWVIQKRAG